MRKITRNCGKEAESIRQKVRHGYGLIARTGGSCCGPSCACGTKSLAKQIGYSAADLTALPKGADMGLSCGNPMALASLKPGEVVLDLGSGGGFDAFIAGRKVGKRGRVIGVDMTPEMIAKARRHIAVYRRQTGLNNVEFRLGEIEHLPVTDASVDVVISNCVINLSPDKSQVWREIARVLKPGGRVAVSDLALLKPLPAKVTKMVEALVGCVAGAVSIKETGRMARAAGLVDIRLQSRPDHVNAMCETNGPLYQQIVKKLPPGTTLKNFITSLEVLACKPPRV